MSPAPGHTACQVEYVAPASQGTGHTQVRHVPCPRTFNEKVGLLDAYQSALNLMIDPRTLRNQSRLHQ